MCPNISNIKMITVTSDQSPLPCCNPSKRRCVESESKTPPSTYFDLPHDVVVTEILTYLDVLKTYDFADQHGFEGFSCLFWGRFRVDYLRTPWFIFRNIDLASYQLNGLIAYKRSQKLNAFHLRQSIFTINEIKFFVPVVRRHQIHFLNVYQIAGCIVDYFRIPYLAGLYGASSDAVLALSDQNKHQLKSYLYAGNLHGGDFDKCTNLKYLNFKFAEQHLLNINKFTPLRYPKHNLTVFDCRGTKCFDNSTLDVDFRMYPCLKFLYMSDNDDYSTLSRIKVIGYPQKGWGMEVVSVGIWEGQLPYVTKTLLIKDACETIFPIWSFQTRRHSPPDDVTALKCIRLPTVVKIRNAVFDHRDFVCFNVSRVCFVECEWIAEAFIHCLHSQDCPPDKEIRLSFRNCENPVGLKIVGSVSELTYTGFNNTNIIVDSVGDLYLKGIKGDPPHARIPPAVYNITAVGITNLVVLFVKAKITLDEPQHLKRLVCFKYIPEFAPGVWDILRLSRGTFIRLEKKFRYPNAVEHLQFLSNLHTMKQVMISVDTSTLSNTKKSYAHRCLKKCFNDICLIYLNERPNLFIADVTYYMVKLTISKRGNVVFKETTFPNLTTLCFNLCKATVVIDAPQLKNIELINVPAFSSRGLSIPLLSILKNGYFKSFDVRPPNSIQKLYCNKSTNALFDISRYIQGDQIVVKEVVVISNNRQQDLLSLKQIDQKTIVSFEDEDATSATFWADYTIPEEILMFDI